MGGVGVAGVTFDHSRKRETEETGKIEFRIDGKVPQWELLGRKKRKPDFGTPITRQEYDRLLEMT